MVDAGGSWLMTNVLIAGCGDVGIALGRELVAEGHTVWGMRRNIRVLPEEIKPLAADLLNDLDTTPLPTGLTRVYFMPTPDARSEESYRGVFVQALRHLLSALEAAKAPVERFFYVSSTSVYGQSDGERVDEQAETSPRSFAGRVLLEGEQLAWASAYTTTVVRFAGIYGPGRDRLVNRVRSGGSCQAEPPSYSNRIHRDDCAGMLRHLGELTPPERLYIGVDDEPTKQCTVMDWLAGRLGVPPPRRESNPAGGRGKRCSNAKVIGSGYRLRYPTFRDGYGEILSNYAN